VIKTIISRLFHHFQLLYTSHCNFERSKNKYDRISTILINAKSGIKHIHDRLEKISTEFTTERIEFDEKNPTASLWSIGNVLVELIARTREHEMNELHNLEFDENDDIMLRTSSLDFTRSMQQIKPFNQRVLLPSAKDDVYAHDPSSPEVYNDLDEEELSRDKVKKASNQILRAATRTKSSKTKA